MGKGKSVVRPRMGGNGQDLRSELHTRSHPHRVRDRMAGDGDLLRLSPPVGGIQGQAFLTPEWQGGLGQLAAYALSLLVLTALAATCLLLLWIILDFLASIFLGVIVMAGLLLVLRVLTQK